MKTTKSSVLFLILIFSAFMISWLPTEKTMDTNTAENITIVLKFKTLEDKEEIALMEFKNLLSQVKKEPYFISIKLHIDPSDETNILLYEEWEDEFYYKTDHMNTPHLKEFMAKSKDFLTGPPEITFWKVKDVYQK